MATEVPVQMALNPSVNNNVARERTETPTDQSETSCKKWKFSCFSQRNSEPKDAIIGSRHERTEALQSSQRCVQWENYLKTVQKASFQEFDFI
nr:hypothetical protein BgiMline_010475 [Biomphalaria glabrata]